MGFKSRAPRDPPGQRMVSPGKSPALAGALVDAKHQEMFIGLNQSSVEAEPWREAVKLESGLLNVAQRADLAPLSCPAPPGS